MAESQQAIVDDDDDSSDNLETFCRTLVYHSQWKVLRILTTGSRAEVPIQHYIVPWLGISMDKLDYDQMIYVLFRLAFSRSQSIPEAYTDEVVRICTEGTHAGYVRLIKEKDNTELLYSECRNVGDGATVHGPAVLLDTPINKAELSNEKYDLGNSEFNEVIHQRMPITDQDKVFAVHSPYWPVEAAEWVTRPRARGFPSRSVIKQVVRYGCDFVPTSHKFSNMNEWRFSFSKAELLIIKSWTLSQNTVYGALWAMKKKMNVNYICTYYFKTLMLWAYEKKPAQFWNGDVTKLVPSVCELLIHLMASLKLNILLNYFIPANNMMDHLIDTNLSHDINALWKYLNSFADILNFLNVVHVATSLNTRDYELPAWVKQAVIIYDQISNEEDTFLDLPTTKLAPDLFNALRVELPDIYSSLQSQQVVRKLKDLSIEHLDCLLIRSEMLLTRTISLCESNERDILRNCNPATVRSIENDYTVGTNQDQREASRPRTEFDTKRKSTTDKSSISKLEAGRKIEIMEHHHSVDRLLREWPGKSPTVNISWFIANAYLANLYYINKYDVNEALRTCDDVIVAYRLSYMNERFAERTFPVILSAELACIYDEEIQELIGFYSLCSFIKNSGINRSVYLGVCPVLFVMYLKLRIADSFTDSFTMDEWTSLSVWQNFYEHFTYSCKCDTKVNSGRTILLLAWRNYVNNKDLNEFISEMIRIDFMLCTKIV